MKELPIYILNGFLDSGKTSFLKDTLDNEEFSQGQNILLIVCEEGEEEYENRRRQRELDSRFF